MYLVSMYFQRSPYPQQEAPPRTRGAAPSPHGPSNEKSPPSDTRWARLGAIVKVGSLSRGSLDAGATLG